MALKETICPAIVTIGYNRPKSLYRLLKSVANAKYDFYNIPLVISIDKSEIQAEVVGVAEDFEWNYGEKIIRTFNERQGLRNHVLQCGDLAEEYGAVILLEDDIVVSPEFYSYTVKALEFYKSEKRIAGISLYSHKYNGFAQKIFTPVHNGFDTYFAQFGVSWGQCWTKDQWNCFRDWYSTNGSRKLQRQDNIPTEVSNYSEKSWGKYFIYYMVETNKYYVMPYEALSTCFADVGEHVSVANTAHQVPLLMGKRSYKFARYEDAEKYDIFFESINIRQYFPKEIADGLCVDLYGLRGRKISNRYLLTSKCKPYKKLKTYGLSMRPKELNIRFEIEGDGIFLYDTQTSKQYDGGEDWPEIYYDTLGLEWRTALKYGIKEFWDRGRRKLNNCFIEIFHVPSKYRPLKL